MPPPLFDEPPLFVPPPVLLVLSPRENGFRDPPRLFEPPDGDGMPEVLPERRLEPPGCFDFAEPSEPDRPAFDFDEPAPEPESDRQFFGLNLPPRCCEPEPDPP